MTLADAHFAPQPMRPRDRVLERHLDSLAVRAAGRRHDGGLSRYAAARAHPGGVRAGLDADREAAEELADAWNYLRWGIEQVWGAYLAGDPDAARVYERRMRALVGVLNVWHDLHTPAG